jgi:DNA-binding response OmpR family regulator
MPARILFVGRQPDQFAPLWRSLSTSGFDVAFAASQTRALRELEEAAADVIILDASSLRSPAEQMCRALRQQAPVARMIVITDGPGLSSACYDYELSPPTTWKLLLDTTQQALQNERRPVLISGEFILDVEQQTIIGPTGEARLTPKLFDLLHLLMSHADELVRRETIMEKVWHTLYLDDTRTLDVHISWLRGILEPNPKKPCYLITKRGAGYIFRPLGTVSSIQSAE